MREKPLFFSKGRCSLASVKDLTPGIQVQKVSRESLYLSDGLKEIKVKGTDEMYSVLGKSYFHLNYWESLIASEGI